MVDGFLSKGYTAPRDGTAESRLAAAVRRLMDATVLTDAGEDEMRAVAGRLDAISEQLEGPDATRLAGGMRWPSRDKMVQGDRDHNPMAGPANPLSPPMHVEVVDPATDEVGAELTMRPIHEGPPAGVHGGWVASLLDQLLGIANIASGNPAMTGELTVRYHRPTPIGVPLVLRARTESAEGRRMTTTGEIRTADGEVTASAVGLFIRPRPERLDQHERLIKERLSARREA
ncbi:MAG TPA: PaaI family thioesterase [Mycobacteriales bacterium]|nr:PaaI family thioesterase [Mycobacteriales bacterium]